MLHTKNLADARNLGQEAYARLIYCPVLVSTNISSPIFTNSGTLTTAPVSSVAGFDPPDRKVSDFRSKYKGRSPQHNQKNKDFKYLKLHPIMMYYILP